MARTEKNKGGGDVIAIDRKRKKATPANERQDPFFWVANPDELRRVRVRRFWRERLDWPPSVVFAGISYVFLGDALLEIGQALAPLAWTGNEQNTWPDYRLLPLTKEGEPDSSGGEADFISFESKDDAWQFAHVTLAEAGKTAAAYELTDEEWVLARNEAHAAWKTNFREPWKRMSAARRAVMRAAVSGELDLWVRPKIGGAMLKTDCADWNFEYPTMAMFMCQLDFDINDRQKHFNQREQEGDSFWWIFVTRDSLDKFLRQHSGKTATTVKTTTKYETWLLKRMSGNSRKDSNKAELRAQFLSENPGTQLSERQGDLIYTAAVASCGNPNWQKKGRIGGK